MCPAPFSPEMVLLAKIHKDGFVLHLASHDIFLDGLALIWGQSNCFDLGICALVNITSCYLFSPLSMSLQTLLFWTERGKFSKHFHRLNISVATTLGPYLWSEKYFLLTWGNGACWVFLPSILFAAISEELKCIYTHTRFNFFMSYTCESISFINASSQTQEKNSYDLLAWISLVLNLKQNLAGT